MAQHVVVASGAPSGAPPSNGAHYVNTANGDVYLATGTASVADWGSPISGAAELITGKEIWTLYLSTDNITEWYAISRDGGESWESDQSKSRDGWKSLGGGELDGPIFTRGQNYIGQAVCINGSSFKS